MFVCVIGCGADAASDSSDPSDPAQSFGQPGADVSGPVGNHNRYCDSTETKAVTLPSGVTANVPVICESNLGPDKGDPDPGYMHFYSEKNYAEKQVEVVSIKKEM